MHMCRLSWGALESEKANKDDGVSLAWSKRGGPMKASVSQCDECMLGPSLANAYGNGLYSSYMHMAPFLIQVNIMGIPCFAGFGSLTV